MPPCNPVPYPWTKEFFSKNVKKVRGRFKVKSNKVKSKLDDLTSKIETWAIVRKLHEANPVKQTLKLGEEFGELCEGLAKGRPAQVKDAIGDMYVVLTILAMQHGWNIEDCIQLAYDEIKDRKGKTVNGVYVKEADLN